MDTQLPISNKSKGVYVQKPVDSESVLAFDEWLYNNKWSRTDFGDYYNKEKKLYMSTSRLYDQFRNTK